MITYQQDKKNVWYARKGSVVAHGTTEEEAKANLEAKFAQPRIELDWKIMLFNVLDGVAKAEGVWFETFWNVTPEERLEILRSYDEYEQNKEIDK